MRTLARLAFLVAAASLAGCDARAIAKPNPRINTWQHVVNVLVPNEAVVDITNDGGSGWVRISVAQDGKASAATGRTSPPASSRLCGSGWRPRCGSCGW
jgi:hypothetical protein